MRASSSHPRSYALTRGFAALDWVMGVTIVGALAIISVASITRISSRRSKAVCSGNLGAIATAVSKHALDHQDSLPGPVPNQGGDFWWYYKDQIRAHAGLAGVSSSADLLFACPSDRGYSDPKPFCLSPRFNFTSYVFNGVTLPGIPNIAGWKLSAVKQPQRTLMVMEWTAHAPLSWHRSRTGKANAPFYNDAESVVAFVDGHVAATRIYYDGYNAAFTRDPIPGYDYKYSGADLPW